MLSRLISWKTEKILANLGVGAFFAAFIAGITINAVPDVALMFESAFCPAGTSVETGTEAGRTAKSGPVGFARCVDGSGATRRDITFPVFLSIFAGATVVCGGIISVLKPPGGR